MSPKADFILENAREGDTVLMWGAEASYNFLSGWDVYRRNDYELP